MDLYFGRVGSLLSVLPSPRPGAPRSRSAQEAVQELLGGGYAVDRAPGAACTWQFEWGWDGTVWWQLNAWYTRQYGPGPFALCDPSCINYLTPAQASATHSTSDATGWSVAAGSSETLASSTALAYSGTRSLLWSLPAAVTSGILTATPPAPLLGWPTPPADWTFSVPVRLGAGDASVDVQAALRWLDSTGAQVSETLGTLTTVGAGAWSTLTATGSPPSGAVYVAPRVKVSAGTVSSTAGVHVGQAQLQLASTASDWRPGEGPALVSFARLAETAQLALDDEQRRDISLTLVQLGLEA